MEFGLDACLAAGTPCTSARGVHTRPTTPVPFFTTFELIQAKSRLPARSVTRFSVESALLRHMLRRHWEQRLYFTGVKDPWYVFVWIVWWALNFMPQQYPWFFTYVMNVLKARDSCKLSSRTGREVLWTQASLFEDPLLTSRIVAGNVFFCTVASGSEDYRKTSRLTMFSVFN